MDNINFPPPYSPQICGNAAPWAAVEPPPMYGPRGPTIPPKHMGPYTRNHRFNNNIQVGGRSSRFQYNRPQNFRTNSNSHSSTTYFCEPCDRSFTTDQQYRQHRSEHQKCGIDQCLFEGHELIVTKHIQQQHSTGLYDKIKNLSTPEDVAKWREERRKRYPTKQNIELRQRIQADKNQRGERLIEPKRPFGEKNNRRHPQQHNDKRQEKNKRKRDSRKRKRKTNKKIESTAINPENCDESVVTDKCKGRLKMFAGTSNLNDYKRPRIENKQMNALSTISGMYASSDENSDHESDENEVVDLKLSQPVQDTGKLEVLPDIVGETLPDNIEPNFIDTEVPPKELLGVKRQKDQVNQTDAKNENVELNVKNKLIGIMDKSLSDCSQENINESDLNSADSQPEELPVERQADQVDPTDTVTSKQNENTHLKDHKRRPRTAAKKTLLDLSKKYRNQNTMLEKLLQKEICHERNVLLQCVRYVVQKNFFGIGQKKDI